MHAGAPIQTDLSGNWAGNTSWQSTWNEVAQEHAITEHRGKTWHRNTGMGGPNRGVNECHRFPTWCLQVTAAKNYLFHSFIWCLMLLPQEALRRGCCRTPIAGGRASTAGQPGHSPQVSTWSPACGGWFLSWLRTGGPDSRRGWQRAGTATGGIIPGRLRCRCDSCTSCCTCTEPLGASLCPGNPPRASHRVPSSDRARARRSLSRHNRPVCLARAAAIHLRAGS